MATRKVQLLEIARSPLGRIATAAVGLGLIFVLLGNVGLDKVISALSRAASLFPIVLLLEAGIIVCTVCALRLLYGEDRRRLPVDALLRAGLVGYSVMGLFPAGRSFAESTRAALLARYSSGAKAAVAGARIQGLALLANAAISFFATLAMLYVLGPTLPTALVAGNMFLTAAVGGAILVAGRSSGFGAWLGRRIPSFQHFGAEFDLHFAGTRLVPLGPFCFEFLGRVLQVLQSGVLVVAVGGMWGLMPALCSEALHLVGAAVGDLIPAQLGATEINYQLSASALSLRPVDALSIALLAHLSQLVWVAIGLVISVMDPIEVSRAPGKYLAEETG